MKEQLENSTTHVNLLNLKTLTNEELLNLSKVMKECQTKGMAAEDNMKELFGEFKLLSEDNQAFVWDRVYDINVRSLKQPSTYLIEQAAAI